MKFFLVAFFSVCISLITSHAMATNLISKEMRDDAEYMMRKVVEDIHQFKVRTTVTDITRDKGIKVVGYALKFTPARSDGKGGETYSCASVSLKTQIKSGKSAREQIKRTDEICTGNQSGEVKYRVNIH